MASFVIRFLSAVALISAALAQSVLAQYPGNAAAGEKVYNETCVACHGPNGTGAFPGVPDLTGKKSPLATRSHKVLLEHILKGFQDSSSPLSMPPKGGNANLTIKDIQNVLKFMHQKFGYRPGNGGKP